MPKQGLHLITPSAAVATGTGSSATINANGSVTFSAVTALDLRGVFSADYDNYQIVMRMTHSLNGTTITGQMISGTSVNATSNYVDQEVTVTGAAITGARSSAGTLWSMCYAIDTQPNGIVAFVYGPNLSQPTVFRTVTVNGTSSAAFRDHAGSHNVSSAFDGIKLGWLGGSGTGLVAVYGMRK